MVRGKEDENPAAVYQQHRQAIRVGHINTYLTHLAGSRARFLHITDLAETVASHITQLEGRKCWRSTILRNPFYKVMLANYLVANPAPGAKNIGAGTLEGAAAQALFIQNRLEIANLKLENARLKAHVLQLKNQNLSSDALPIDSNERTDFGDNLSFVRTCQVLLRVMENLDGLIVIDPQTEELLDKSRFVNNVIANKQLVGPYLEWLRANRTG